MSFNLIAVVQAGRLEHEAILLAASLRLSDPGFPGTLFLAEPQPGPKWQGDPRISDRTRKVLTGLGAQILPFETRAFGSDYPHGNKIEALAALPEAPFLFLDTDTLVTGPLSAIPFDFSRPSASMRRENTWPKVELYGPTATQTWQALYDRFGLDFASSWDTTQPEDYWQRFLYFNAGWFFHESPRAFGNRFLDFAREIRDAPPEELVCQELYPWLDQIALPLVIHSFGGGRPGPELAALDGAATCHYRTLPLLYAREDDRVVQVLERLGSDPELRPVLRHWGAFKRMVIQGEGARARALFDRADLPRREQMIRNRLKREGLWIR
ncbi:hypothetical protein [Rhodobacter calidifons]|uniref:Uncharacterized protein n=1 Tax=Rhodobacter calidifons TaxID=2715277 RepID=A0ABX0G7Y4_9RHOB|nr:hypothetical protein [Rhodobacter calidifons]NHB77032.1 hypothetical protein [Rhodobacter calidifons]